MKWIPTELYKQIRSILPVACVDLVIASNQGGILLGLRNNKPDKDKWGLPGGRILHGETLLDAVHRIAKEELGVEVNVRKQMGIYEAIQEDFHAIGIPYLVNLGIEKIKLDSQHREWRWFTELDDSVAPYAQEVIKGLMC